MDASKKIFDVVDTTPYEDPTPTPKKAVTYPIAPLDRDRDCYNFNYKNRGKAIIFNHQEFHASQRYEDRRGTMKDAKSLEVELKKLDFDVESHLNLKTDDVQLVVDRTSAMDHSQNDCIVFVILSHGHLGSFSTYDSVFKLDDLFSAFMPDKCPSLAGKPKIFIIQACRNKRNGTHDQGIDKGIIFGEQFARVSSRALKDFTDREIDKRQLNYSLPSQSDLLVGYATSPGFYSFRSEDGSHYIQALCRELAVNAIKLPLFSILTNVNRFIATQFEANSDDERLHGAKQMPHIHSTLTRTLIFNDKTLKPEEQTDSNHPAINGMANVSTQTEPEEKSLCSKIVDRICCLR